jgi:hypothetical protein
VGPAGSVWSSERVVHPSPLERPASEIITPGLRQLKPTPPRSNATNKIEAFNTTEVYRSHAIFRDPSYADVAHVNSWDSRDNLSKDVDCFDHKYNPSLHQNDTFDQFNKITTSYSETIKDYSTMGRSRRSLENIDQMMQGDGDDMVLFGRWRHHKDAPLSFVKDMIEQELRGPGACSLYGPGGLKTSDHPLVCHYNERLRRLHAEEEIDLQTSTTSALSPVLMHGRNASQRSLLRLSTPVTFNMSKDGTFQTTGFHQRSASDGSTVESMSPTGSFGLETHNAQKDARRDSGIHCVQSDTSLHNAPNKTGDTSLGNYEVLRCYTPDPALDCKALNEGTAPRYRRRQVPMVTPYYVENFCGGIITTVENLTSASNTQPVPRIRVSQEQRPHAQRVESFVHSRTPYQQAPQAQFNRNGGREPWVQTDHNKQQNPSKRYKQEQYHDYTTHHQRRALPTCHTQRQPYLMLAPRNEALKMEQPKRVSCDITNNTNFAIPALQRREVTLVAPEDAEDAMFSDEEDTIIALREVPEISNASSPQPISRSALDKQRTNDASQSANHTTPSSDTKKGDVTAVSNSSSVASAAANETAGLDASTEFTPYHATPGTTASSGDERQIKSPARAASIARKLNEHLKQIEPLPSDKNNNALEEEHFNADD